MEKCQETNEKLKAIIEHAKIDAGYVYRSDELLDEKVHYLAQHCQQVLDVGKSSRHRYTYFKKMQIVTLDINQFDSYPDVIDDICDLHTVLPSSFDAVICMAVLEHVYNPHLAVQNLYSILRMGGYCLLYVPFLYRYHAPNSLVFQEYFHFTRDGIAYLLRDFSEVTIYPCRGPYSTIFNLWSPWKGHFEKKFGQKLNKLIDKVGTLLYRQDVSSLQASGYFVWAVK